MGVALDVEKRENWWKKHLISPKNLLESLGVDIEMGVAVGIYCRRIDRPNKWGRYRRIKKEDGDGAEKNER